MRIKFGLVFLLLGVPALACPGCWKAAGNGWQLPQDPGGMQAEPGRRLPEPKTEQSGRNNKLPDKPTPENQQPPVVSPTPPTAPEKPR